MNERIDNLEQTTSTQITNLSTTYEPRFNSLVDAQANLTSTVNNLAQTLQAFISTQMKGGNSNDNGGTPSTPSSPCSGESPPSTSSNTPPSYLHAKAESEGKRVVEYPSCTMISVTEPDLDNDDVYFTENNFLSTSQKSSLDEIPGDGSNLPEIMPLHPADQRESYARNICTADLEAIIEPNGHNYVYMAAWYSGPSNLKGQSQVYNLTQFSSKESFLKAFWSDLIANNEGRTCYFHNWVGMTVFFLFHIF